MNIYFSSSVCPQLAVLAMLATPLSVSMVHAQNPMPVLPSASMKPMNEAAPALHRSALDSFKPYTDEKTVNWKEANDVTARIGGWREYAKEAQQSDVMPEVAPKDGDKASAPATQPLPVKP